MKKRKLNATQRKLVEDWEALQKRHSKPLEKGAKSKAVTGQTGTLSRRGSPLLESTRVSTELSVDTGYASTARKQDQKYTGDKVLGVALMHKSSYAPVFNAEAAVDIAKMRR